MPPTNDTDCLKVVGGLADVAYTFVAKQTIDGDYGYHDPD